MSDVETELQTRVHEFVDELSALIRRQALAAVEEVLEKGEGAAPAVRRGRPPKALAAEAVAVAPGRAGRAYKPVISPRRKAGEKRSASQLGQITEQVHNYIKSNPGQGVELIAKTLATSTKELTLPIRKLLAEKKIGSKGQKRATRYFPR